METIDSVGGFLGRVGGGRPDAQLYKGGCAERLYAGNDAAGRGRYHHVNTIGIGLAVTDWL
jgi:hypothetical protein